MPLGFQPMSAVNETKCSNPYLTANNKQAPFQGLFFVIQRLRDSKHRYVMLQAIFLSHFTKNKNIFTNQAFRDIIIVNETRRTVMDLMTVGMYLIGALIAFYIIKSSLKFLFSIIILGALGYAVYVYIWPALQPMLNN